MTTWTEVNGRLSYFLDDNPAAAGQELHALPLRIAGWNWAQRMFQAHTRRERSVDLTLAVDQLSADLPADFLRVAQVYVPGTGKVYGRQMFEQSGSRLLSQSYTYWVWNNQLHFNIAAGGTLTLDYQASWPEITFSLDSDGVAQVVDDVILIPQWAEMPLIHLTASIVLQPQAIQAAMSRNSNSTIDSGRPEDNSRRVQAREHFWWYQTLINLVPPQVQSYGGGS